MVAIVSSDSSGERILLVPSEREAQISALWVALFEEGVVIVPHTFEGEIVTNSSRTSLRPQLFLQQFHLGSLQRYLLYSLQLPNILGGVRKVMLVFVLFCLRR